MTGPARVLLKGGLLVTMDSERRCFVGDLRLAGDRIEALGANLRPQPGETVIAVDNCFVIPGLIQAHTHLCQALFRGLADDLSLLDWLTKKIWPFEASHTEASMLASARLGLLEMQLLGTTAILDMGSTRHTDAVFEAVAESGMRYWGGNCLADLKSASGPLYVDTKSSLQESERLLRRWHQSSPLISYALCPRFAVSCTERILRETVALQNQHQVLIHTHASENKDEIALVKKRSGLNNVEYFAQLGLLSPSTVLVHGIHLTKSEVGKIVRSKTKLVHCPSSNLKLASGIAPITEYLRRGMVVGLGSDGAPCNNTMDPFLEMRLAALIQKPPFGPEALPAEQAFELATLGGARVLGMESSLGSLEAGKLADVVVVRRDHPSCATVENPYSALVYSCSGRDVRDVFIHGRQVVKDSSSLVFAREQVLAQAKAELARLRTRLN
ncbi:MAG: amidohydrolase family protein [Bdellovibrionales bacterium]|nr:amidohydrolase family protein [Bdellovibrionales bacterium]